MRYRHWSRKPAGVIQTESWRKNLGPCALKGLPGHVCEGKVRGHHLIPRQSLRRHGFVLFEWDIRNRLSVCDRAHHSHHTRARPIPRALLPESVFVFADELGLGWLLSKLYPEQHVEVPVVTDAANTTTEKET